MIVLHLSYLDSELYDVPRACSYLSSAVMRGLERGLAQDGYASLVLTGGESITHFFKAFRQMDLDWSRINVFLTDDRMVSDSHPASNEAQLRRLFLDTSEIGARPRYLSIKNGEEPLYETLSSAIAVLSMGGDGHVASLFTPADLQGSGCLAYIARPDYDRVSLSYKTLQAIGKKYIIVYGTQKIEFLGKINMDDFYLGELFLSSEIIQVKE